MLFISSLSGQFNLWLADTAGGPPEQLTVFEHEAVRSVNVTAGAVIFAADRNGTELRQLYRLAGLSGSPEQLTDSPNVQHTLSRGAGLPDGRFVYTANSRTPSDVELFLWNEDHEKQSPLFGEGMYVIVGAVSPDGRHVPAAEFRSNSDSRLWLVDIDARSASPMSADTTQARFAAGPWNSAGTGFYLLSDEDREYQGIAFQNIVTGERRWLETPACDIDEIAGSADGRLLTWTENVDGWTNVRLRDCDTAADLPIPDLPAGVIGAGGAPLAVSPDGAHLAIVWEQPERPPEIWVVETATGEAAPVTRNRSAGLARTQLGAPQLIRYESADGQQIPAWLYTPQTAGPSPFAVLVHGGPEAQERPVYRAYIQYLLAAGIGVLAPNIRGSTGYGKTYQRAIYRDWGGVDLTDLRAAAEWLSSQPYVNRDRLAVFGTSYGGFATLACISQMPETWSAAVSIVGPSNLVTFARAVPPSWRRLMAAWVGDPDEDEAFLLGRSPITYADQIRAPLLVIQGANDPRVVRSESDTLVERLRTLGREVDYVVFEDEGHGFTRHESLVRAYSLTCDWLTGHLR